MIRRTSLAGRSARRASGRRLAAVLCLAVVAAGSLVGATAFAEGDASAEAVILTAARVPIPKGGDFTAVVLEDEIGVETTFPGNPAEWFQNAEFISLSAPNEDGSIRGIYIDPIAGEVLMVEGGDRVNLLFMVDGKECEFSFGPGAQIAAQKTEGGFGLLADKTTELSPPQEGPIE